MSFYFQPIITKFQQFGCKITQNSKYMQIFLRKSAKKDSEADAGCDQ